MRCTPIGQIRTPHRHLEQMPVQPPAARGLAGQIELWAAFQDGLADLAGFSHLIVLYQFHRVGDVRLQVTPFLDHQLRGLFATRAPCRPNPIGLSVLRLKSIDGPVLNVEDVDMLDGTPVLDLKPYVPAFDQPVGPVRSGWLEQRERGVAGARSDGRFVDPGREENHKSSG